MRRLLRHLPAATLALAMTDVEPVRAHQEPPSCTQTLIVAEIDLFESGSVEAMSTPVSECEYFFYRVRLRKGLATAEYCAFEGGQVTLTLPDGAELTDTAEVPCIGGDVGACDRDFYDLFFPYNVQPQNIVEGQIHASVEYGGAMIHNGTSDTAGGGALGEEDTAIVFCEDDDLCTDDNCNEDEHGEAACSNPFKYCEDVDICTDDSCDADTGECVFTHNPENGPDCVDEPQCGDANEDGDLTAADALIALRTAVGSDDCPPAVCDVNGNGEIATSDALAILRAAVGLPTSLPCAPA